MFGFKLTHRAELTAQASRIADLEKQLEWAMAEIEHWRDRADGERERADRQIDVIMQQNGLPEVTVTSINEKKTRVKEEKDEAARQQSEMNEMFAETIGTMHNEEGLELPEELYEAAKEFIVDARTKESRRKG